ncbi:MAG: hypothetical protein R3220_02710 [Balneolaceae bacterium]|nr:hypothetical protein [Balneolaceae bacterium]
MWKNSMLKRSTFILTLLLLIAATTGQLNAQDNSKAKSGSFYSAVGFGYPADVYSPETMGIGLSGVSNYSGLSSNFANPAHWGLIRFTQGSIGLGLDSFKSVDNTNSSKSTMLGIESFQFAFPLLRDKLGVSLSFMPVVRADFKRRENGFIDPFPETSQEDVEYLISRLGTGGLNRFEAGLGFQPSNNISLGYAFSANLLAIDNNVTPIFSNLQYTPAPYEIDIEGYDFGHRFGIYAYKGGILRNDDQLSVGATVSLPVSIDAERTVSSFRTVNNQRVLIELNENDPQRDGTVKLPLEFNTGLTYNLNRLSNFVAELKLQNWDDAKFSFNPIQQGYFKDRMKVGLGYQYHPYRADQRDGFFSNFKYSIGTTYDNGHLSINDQDIETILFHGGIGIMTGLNSQRSYSSIDLSFHYGIRGTDSSNLVKETIWGFKLSLNLAEFMFVQQKFQ